MKLFSSECSGFQKLTVKFLIISKQNDLYKHIWLCPLYNIINANIDSNEMYLI